MIDPSGLEEQCPKCNGKGGIENAEWYHNLPICNSRVHILETKKNKSEIVKDETPGQPDEPIFFLCRNCYGRGKVLTAKGKRLVEFVRFWMNPNY